MKLAIATRGTSVSLLAMCAVLLILGFSAQRADAQGVLLKVEPFDQVSVSERTGVNTHRIKPVFFPEGHPPQDPNPRDSIKVELLDVPGKEYEVQWRVIRDYQQFEDMFLEEANKLLQQKQFDLVYQYIERLRRDYPDHKGIQPLWENFLVQNAFERFQAGSPSEALGILEEAKRLNPDRPNIDRSISNVAQALVGIYVEKEDYAAARTIINRYKATNREAAFPFIAHWENQLNDMASKLRDQSQKAIDAGDERAAYRFGQQMMEVSPTLPGGAEFYNDVIRRYPIVYVATTAGGPIEASPDSLTWGAARDSRLLNRTLCEIVGYGAEGGEYTSPFGTVARSADGQSIALQLRARQTSLTGYDLSRQFMTAANQQNRVSTTGFLRLIDTMAVQGVRRLSVQLRVPHVRPEALLRIVPQIGNQSTDQPQPNGPYQLVEGEEEEGPHFLIRDDYQLAGPQQPREIIYREVEFTRQGLDAMRSGEIHVIDRLYPATARRLLTETRDDLVVEAYRTPTIHVLVPNYENPFLKKRSFRRALAFGINRRAILNGRLLGDQEMEGSRLISAPIPAGINADDPIAYGYDTSLAPRPYEPQMTVALRRLTEVEMERTAEENETEVPELGTLVLGHPDSEVSREACTAIVQYLGRVGIECELKVVDSEITSPTEAEVDLLYVELLLTEPLVDVPRLFERYLPDEHLSQYFKLALRELGQSRSWQEARERFWTFHRLAHDELPIIPLYQIQDYFAYSRTLAGVGYRPMNLYQQIERWDLAPAVGGLARND